MEEYLDYFDENNNYLGYELRTVIHEKGLWHRTVQNWLYTHDGKVLFQIRKDENLFYTTSSGHVRKGETVEEAFNREMNEELGLTFDIKKAKMIELVTWKKDFTKKDGTLMKDRAKSSFYVVPYEGDYTDFNFDPEEVLGVGVFDAKKLLEMFENNSGTIDAIVITSDDGKLVREEREVSLEEFLVLKDETALEKYGNVLKNIIRVCENEKEN